MVLEYNGDKVADLASSDPPVRSSPNPTPATVTKVPVGPHDVGMTRTPEIRHTMKGNRRLGGMIHVHTLGTARIHVGSRRLTPAAGRRFGLLLYLAAVPGHRTTRATLRTLFFPGVVRDSACHGLRELLYQVRRSGAVVRGDAHVVELEGTVKADWSEVSEAKRGGRLSASVLNRAAGGFLPGYAPTHSSAFSDWYEGFRRGVIRASCRTLDRELTRARSPYDARTVESIARVLLALGGTRHAAAAPDLETRLTRVARRETVVRVWPES
jgi:hypothetical protein